MQPQIFVGQRASLCAGKVSSIGASGLPHLVFVHAPPELFDRLLVSAEDHSLVMLFAFFDVVLIQLSIVLGERADFVAEDFTLFGDFSVEQLFEQLLLPLLAAVAVHCVEEFCVGAYSANVDAGRVLVLGRKGIRVDDQEQFQVVLNVLNRFHFGHVLHLNDLLS